MSTLYLIDNGRVIPFNLNTKFGINIGTMDGQVTAATAVPVIFPVDDEGGTDHPDIPIEPETGSGPTAEDSPVHRLAERPRYLKISTLRKQYTLLFNKELGVVSIIGASDIDLNIIGASDIDLNIIGASDIDLNIARKPVEEEETEPASEPLSAVPVENTGDRCQLFSFYIKEKSINLRKVGGLLIIRY